MKGLVIFHEHEISYCHVDKELEKYARDRWRYLEMSAGATEESMAERNRDLTTVLQEFLQPFCTAFNVLVSLKKQMHSITLEDSFLIVFRKFGNGIFVALSSGHGHTEENLSKKLHVFNSVISFLVGPVRQRICPRDLSEKKRMWQLLSRLLATYERLYNEEQVFLLEAVEHVTFGQLQAAQEVVVKLAKESLDSSNNGGLPHVQHAMLLVNSKLLAICGKVPQILTSDILLMTLFVRCFFLDTDQSEREQIEAGEEELAGENYETPGGVSDDQTFPEELDSQTSVTAETGQDRSEVFQTPPMSTPGPSSFPHRQYSEPEDPPFSTPGPEADPQFTTPIEEVDGLASMRESVNPSRGIPSRLRSLFVGLRGSKSGDVGAQAVEEVQDDAKFMEQLVFLQPHGGTFIPHRLHCLEVYPGIVLVLISEYGLAPLAGTISQILHHLDDIFNANHRGGQSVFDVLEEAFRRTNSLVRHEVQATASNVLKQSSMRVQNAWGNLKMAGLRRYLMASQGDEEVNLARLDSSSSNLVRRVVELFEQLFFTPKQCEYDRAHVRSRLIRNFSCLKKDYGEFLALKGTMNIPMLNFSMCHPGMIHFILIDRSFDEMTTPSIHSEQPVGLPYIERLAAEKKVKSGELLKTTVWEMVKRSQSYLGQGYVSQTWLDQHFLYSYYVWVNIPAAANRLSEPARFCSPTVKITDTCVPGVIGTHFYRDLAEGQCYVYELYCIHEAAVPIKTAAMQCKELANQLWPNSKEAVAPFSLIN